MNESPYEPQAPRHVCPDSKPRRVRPGMIVLWVTVAVVLLAALAGGIRLWLDSRNRPAEEPPFSSDAQSVSPTTPPPNTVTVTVPEGYTVQKIAALMEEKGVCTAAEFLQAVQEADLSDYEFIERIPLVDSEGVANGRVYRLEGYLFPDTYEFYKNSSGEAAVRRFVDNFFHKVIALETALEESGLSLDEAVTLASIIQWEAGCAADMPRISRVLWNRLESADYPRLQCDATARYLRELSAAGVEVQTDAYDTYVCRGLPVGAIGNPGLDALRAAVSPSDEEMCAGCYFFVTDEVNKTVYYSKTYAQHLAAWEAIQNGSKP